MHKACTKPRYRDFYDGHGEDESTLAFELIETCPMYKYWLEFSVFQWCVKSEYCYIFATRADSENSLRLLTVLPQPPPPRSDSCGEISSISEQVTEVRLKLCIGSMITTINGMSKIELL